MKLAWILCAVQVAWAAGPIELSLKRAVEVAVSPEGNTRIQLSDEALKQAQAKSAEARAALLPDLEASLTDRDQTANLAAMGIKVVVPIPGFQFPTFVGPFTTMDARATVTQSVFDFSSIRRFQASKVGVSAARSDVDSTEEQVAAQVARAYLAAVRADADVETAQSDVTLAEAVLKQAENQKAAGTGTGIEITRAKVQLANDRQRLLVAGNQRTSARLQLLRVMGLRLDTELELTDKLAYMPVDAVTMEQARAQALKERPDLRRSRSGKPTRAWRPAPPRWSGCHRFRPSAITAPSARASTTRCPRARMASRCGCRYSMAAGATPGARNRRRNFAPKRSGPTI